MINRTEQEIMHSWKNNSETPLVSICCATYNHEPYISDAIKGFLMQETDFPFEILIRDDCSTDRTAEIVKQYADQYPQLIKPVYEKENTYSKGVKPMPQLYKRAKGKYIALCEGDDYWTDKNKLQIQSDVLENNKELDLSFHKAMKVDMGNQEHLEIGDYLDNNGIISIEKVILKSKGQIPTASTVFNKKVVEHIVAFQSQRPWLTAGDIYVHFFGSKRGGAYFINKTMSVYRHRSEGSWTSMYQDDYKKRIIHADSRIKSYEELDTIEMNRFTPVFKQANKKRVLGIITDLKIPYVNKVLFIFKHGKYFSINEKIAYYGLVLIPFSAYLPKDASKFLKKMLNMPSK